MDLSSLGLIPDTGFSFYLCSEFLATDPEVRVRFPALPDVLKVAGLERGPLSLVSTVEELIERRSSGFGLEIREYCRKDPPR
jgi:hypothetical protein